MSIEINLTTQVNDISVPLAVARDAYQLAVADGFQGTREDWLAGEAAAALQAAAAAESAGEASQSADAAAASAAAAAESAGEATQSASAAATSAATAADASRLTIGTVTTGEPGSETTVAITGEAGAQILDFSIPRGETGPQGPPAPSYQRKFDSALPYQYFGTALIGSSDAAEAWTIRRITYDAAGVQTEFGDAAGVTWTDRASHDYL
jgi:hypothetical protein